VLPQWLFAADPLTDRHRRTLPIHPPGNRALTSPRIVSYRVAFLRQRKPASAHPTDALFQRRAGVPDAEAGAGAGWVAVSLPAPFLISGLWISLGIARWQPLGRQSGVPLAESLPLHFLSYLAFEFCNLASKVARDITYCVDAQLGGVTRRTDVGNISSVEPDPNAIGVVEAKDRSEAIRGR
jgi:hypothetical protein